MSRHWSCTHDGYWSAVRYGYAQTPKKPEATLDKNALRWQREGDHPSLFEASKPGVTAPALRKKASGEGKPEPRATELDLYSIIVQQGFRNTADDPWVS